MNALRALFLGFLNPRTYADACYRWLGVGFGLLMLLILLGTIFLTWRATTGLNGFLQDDLPEITRQIPEIRFIDGTATTPRSKRYEIVEPGTGATIAIIDTSVAEIPADLGGAQAFIGKHALTVQKNELEQRTYSYSEWESFTLDDEFIAKATELTKTWAPWVMAPFIFIGMLIARSIQWLFFGLPIMLYMNARKVVGDYSTSLRLSALAMTPVVIVDILLSALSQSIPFAGWAFMGAVILVGFAGVEFAKGEAESSSDSPTPPSLPPN